MNRSGSPSGCDTDRVLEFGLRDTELFGDIVEVLARPESREHVGDACSSAAKGRLSEGEPGVGDHGGTTVLRKGDALGPTVIGEGDPFQTGLDDLGEHPLTIADHDKFANRRRGLRVGVVIEQFRTVGVELARG